MGLAERTLNRAWLNITHLGVLPRLRIFHIIPLTLLFLAAAVAVAAGRMYGALPPPPEMSLEAKMLVAGAAFLPGVAAFGALFWKFRSELFFMCMLVFIMGVCMAAYGTYYLETNGLVLNFFAEPRTMECSPVSGDDMPDGAVLCVP